MTLPIVDKRPSETTWQLIEKTADHIWESGVAQECKFRHRSSVVLTLLKGWELGLPLMSSLEHVRLIHGHFSLSAECQQALVLARVPGSKFEWVADGKGGVAEVSGERPGHARAVVRFTHEDAVKTGMAERNPIYRTFPANLLRSAAMRGLCKRLFPDVLLGVEGPVDGLEEEAAQESGAERPPVGLPVRDAEASERASERPTSSDLSGATKSLVQRAKPEDRQLPFTSGKWANTTVSQLSNDDLFAMVRGFTKRLREAENADDRPAVEVNEAWLKCVNEWIDYRGLSRSA